MSQFPTAGGRQRRQELVIAFVLIILAVICMLVFAQEKILYYLAGGLAIAALLWAQFNSKRWVYLVFLSIPFSPSIPLYQLKYTITAELSDIVVAATMFIFFLNYSMGGSRRKSYDGYVMIPLVVYFFICMLSSLLGYYILNAVGHLLKWAGYAFLYVVIYKSFNKKEDLINLLRVIIVSLGMGSLVTLFKYAAVASGGTEIHRVGGWFEGLNSYGVLLAVVFVFYFNLILQKKSKEIFPTWVMFSLCAGILLALVATLSRTAWFGMAASLVAVFFLRGQRHIGIILIFFTILVFWVLRGPVESRLEATFSQPSTITPFDLGGRDGIWKNSWRVAKSSFFFGVGYMNLQIVKMGTTAHNQYLGILCDSGVFALIAFIFFLARLFKANLYLWRHHPLPFFKECAFASLVVLCMTIFVSIAGEYFQVVIPHLMAFYSCARLSLQMIRENNGVAKVAPTTVPIGYQYLWNRQ